MSDLFDSIISNNASERPAFRQAPPGEYFAKVQGVKTVKANSGTQGLELTFTLVEPAQKTIDMEGVELAKCRLRDTLWVTEKSLTVTQEKLSRINSDTVNNTIRDALDILPGSDVVVRLSHETQNRDGSPLNTPRLKVDAYYSVGWYSENRMAA
jgi:hypothetical protein